MWITCQHAWRLLRNGDSESTTDDTKSATFALLNEAYLKFSADAAALATVLGARYGVEETESTGQTTSTRSRVSVTWHQIRDLMTIYYYNLLGRMPEELLKTYSQGYKEKRHSGLELRRFFADPAKPKSEELTDLRETIVLEYLKALEDLTTAMMKDRIKVSR